MTFTWQYDINDDCASQKCTGSNPPLTANRDNSTPITKLCITYTIASEPGVTKHCNLFGQSNSTSNPTNCD